jgi:hypothetical protein
MLKNVMQRDQSEVAARKVIKIVRHVQAGHATGLQTASPGLETRHGPAGRSGMFKEPASSGAEVKKRAATAGMQRTVQASQEIISLGGRRTRTVRFMA